MPKSRMFIPVDMSQPGALNDLLSLHKGIFGGYRMEDEPEPNQNSGEQTQQRGPGSDATKKLSEMTIEERAEYFEKKANRLATNLKGYSDYDDLKAERDRLLAASQTDQEKEVADAKAAGRAESDAVWQQRLAAAELRGALGGTRTAEQIQTLIEPLDLTKFLTSTGEVDTDKVTRFAATFGTTVDPSGQGRQSAGTASKGDAGRAEAEKRFGTKS